jgi:ABC-2 type transport system permease protein
MRSRLSALIRKEFIQTLRDIPIVFLVLYSFGEIALCGWALTMDVRHLPTAVLDRDHSPASRALVERFREASAFDVSYFPASETELERMLDSGQATLGLVIPPGLGRDLAGGQPAQIQVLADGTQSNITLLAVGYVQQIVQRYSAEIQVAQLGRLGQAQALSGLPSIVNQVRAWYLPDMQYIHFNMVAMVTLSVVMLGILLAAASIVREKEAGTLDQLMVTPIRPMELILAKLLPMVALELIGLGVGVSLSYVMFGVAPHGNPLAVLAPFFALSTLAFLASAGIGVWIASLAHNLMQALMLAFFILFPMMFLSGLLSPVAAMPQWLQWIAFFNPMQHYLTLALSLFLKGGDFNLVTRQAAMLAAFTVVIVSFAVFRFRRTLA